MAGRATMTIFQMLTGPVIGRVLESWIDADGAVVGDATSEINWGEIVGSQVAATSAPWNPIAPGPTSWNLSGRYRGQWPTTAVAA